MYPRLKEAMWVVQDSVLEETIAGMNMQGMSKKGTMFVTIATGCPDTPMLHFSHKAKGICFLPVPLEVSLDNHGINLKIQDHKVYNQI